MKNLICTVIILFVCVRANAQSDALLATDFSRNVIIKKMDSLIKLPCFQH